MKYIGRVAGPNWIDVNTVCHTDWAYLACGMISMLVI